MLRITVINSKGRKELSHDSGPLEFGRVMQGTAERVLLDDPFVSRDQLRIQEVAGKLQVENLSRQTVVQILGRPETIDIGATSTVALPVAFSMGQTRVEVTLERVEESRGDWQTILRPAQFEGHTLGPINLTDSREPLTPQRLAHWFETVISVQRAAAGSAEFYQETVRAVVELVGLDGALVLLRHGERWETVAAHVRAGGGSPPTPSRTILNRMLEQRRTFYRTLEAGASGSLMGIEAVVVSPISDGQGEIVGAIYGQRYQKLGSQGPAIEPLEAQLVQLLAAAAGAGLARQQQEAEAARSRVQFEQFFSSALAQQLQADPTMLDGRDCQVTVLFSDIRGFSSHSERLAPAETCRLVGDVMERLTGRIVEHGGVVVDYVGDGLLAMWNAPVAQADHAVLACRAARAMLDELPALNETWRDTLGVPLGLGLGLNTGPARVGNIGSRRRFKYGPLGHTVNLASRIEGLSKHLGVTALLSGSTREALGTSLATRRLCRARVVGIATPVEVYELCPTTSEDKAWCALRDSYEAALGQFETGDWARACRTLYPLLASQPDRYDVPSLTLIGRAVDCLKKPTAKFDPVLDFSQK
jgi:adenylate cyclase